MGNQRSCQGGGGRGITPCVLRGALISCWSYACGSSDSIRTRPLASGATVVGLGCIVEPCATYGARVVVTVAVSGVLHRRAHTTGGSEEWPAGR